MSTPTVNRNNAPTQAPSRPQAEAPNRASQAAQARQQEAPRKTEDVQKPVEPQQLKTETPQKPEKPEAPERDFATFRQNFSAEKTAPRNTNSNFGGFGGIESFESNQTSFITGVGELPQSPQLEAGRPKELPTGTLDYYEQRAQDFEQRHPGQDAPDYYREYGDKYVHKFDELKPELSDQGDAFVDATRQNLQEAMEKKRREDPEGFARLEQDPDALRAFAFDTHSQAYLDGGIADLPPEDLLKIVTTPDFKDSLSKDGLREIGETVGPVLAKHPELLATVPAELLGQLYDLYPKIDLPGPLPQIPVPPVIIPVIPFL